MTPKPTRQDLLVNDTPAQAILRDRPQDFPGVDAADLALCQDLLRVSKRALSGFADQFAAHGISPGRYSVLMELLHSDRELAPSEIAERVGVSRATITGLIDGLVRERLVLRGRVDAADRRRRGVRLSAKGRELLESLLPRVFQQMVAAVAPLSARERDQLARLLHKVEEALSVPGGSRSEPGGEG